MEEQLKAAALEYHATPTPGKISVAPTKGLTNQRDLALAYSPGRCLRLQGDRGRTLAEPRGSPRAPIWSA